MMIYPNFFYEKLAWKKGFNFVGGCDEVGRGAFAGPIMAGCVVFSPEIAKSDLDECVVFDRKQLMTHNLGLIKKMPIHPWGESTRTPRVKMPLINDSKKLTSHQRIIADKWIKHNCLTWGIGIATVSEINKKGITRAGASAFRRAVSDAGSRLGTRIQFILIDAFYIPYINGIRMPVKKHKLSNKVTKQQINGLISGRQLAIVKGDEKSLSIAAASIIAKVYRDKLMTNLSKNQKYKKYGWDKNKGYGTKFHRDVILENGVTTKHRKKYIRTFLDKIDSRN